MEVATAVAMRNIDQRTIDTFRVPGIVLMENAGLALLQTLEALWPNLALCHVTILTGAGNNGGDGFILARHLWHRGTDVDVIMLTAAGRLRGDARRAYDMARAYHVPMTSATTPQAWSRTAPVLKHTSLIVDAMLGSGLQRPASGLYAEVIASVNEAPQPTVAVDIPSGLSADHGRVAGPHICATHTVTFALPKRGLLTYPAAAAVGELHIVDIGIPQAAIEAEEIDVAMLQEADIRQLLPQRHPNAHKGSHGHVLVVAGSVGKSGAAVLASQSALRAGAGLVTLAVPAGLNAAMEVQLTEVMTLPVAESPDGCMAASAYDTIEAFWSNASAMIIGPGLGIFPETQQLVQRLLQCAPVPIVLDADGLTLIADQPHILQASQVPLILTPHPGELGRLLKVSPADIQADRLDVALDFVRDTRVHLILKGAHTVIYTPDRHRWINCTGNAAMATAGTGDVLAGLIGALLAQGLSPLQAAQGGVYLHGLAGDQACAGLGSTGLIASDLIQELPHAMHKVRQGVICQIS
ncbi:NAD(P)H-hydrate dehydratase [Candidatus Entotheonella palauensis]|uniref:NAD(P)H-hydrate dehydratase n=1 Tax=Candidatus Entotheonella palauensis TaxID=93172 RepID=UPI000B7E4314|nr:NAD(P)H-hydrate dehydratase [Candidatus Entotheonella palauensis]